MKRLWIAAVLLLVAGTCAMAEDTGYHLFILSGQSNMAGLKPEVSFTPAVTEAFGADHVIVVKDALGGQPIYRWYKQWKPPTGDVPAKRGDLYDRLMTKVNAAIKGKRINSVTFVWMQDERDARMGWGKVYAESLKGVFKQLGEDLSRTDIHYVIGRISDFDMANKQYPHWTMVRDAQVELAKSTEHCQWVDTDALNGPNNGLHYTAEGYRELGKRFAEKAVAMIKQ